MRAPKAAPIVKMFVFSPISSNPPLKMMASIKSIIPAIAAAGIINIRPPLST